MRVRVHPFIDNLQAHIVYIPGNTNRKEQSEQFLSNLDSMLRPLSHSVLDPHQFVFSNFIVDYRYVHFSLQVGTLEFYDILLLAMAQKLTFCFGYVPRAPLEAALWSEICMAVIFVCCVHEITKLLYESARFLHNPYFDALNFDLIFDFFLTLTITFP